MADNVSISEGTGTLIAADDVGGVQFQRVKVTWGVNGVAGDVSAANPLPVSVDAVPLPSDAATQTTLAAVLAKIIASPSTAAKQDTIIAAVDGLETLLSAAATQTTLAAVLAKIITAPSTEAKQDTIITSLTTLAGLVDGLEALLAAATPAGSNIIGRVGFDQTTPGTTNKVVADHSTTGIGHGKKTVTTAGTDVVLAGSTAAKWVTIQAYRANTAMIAVGATGVDATAATGDGATLAAGESITLPIDNLADVFIDATVNGEGVRFTYGV